MSKSKVLVGLVLAIYLCFIVFEISDEFNIAFLLDSVMIPVITAAYIMFCKKKNKYFLLFLIFFSISEILGVVTHYILYYNLPYKDRLIYYEYDYYIGSALYIIGYAFLLVKVGKEISLKYVLRNFKIHVIVLTALNIYLIYVLQLIVESELEYEYEYHMELVYNVVMLLLLSIAMLTYFYRDNKKSLYLFIGALFIVFSEVLDVAYNYIDQRSLLNILGTTLALCAFYFFYQQALLKHPVNTDNERFALIDEY